MSVDSFSHFQGCLFSRLSLRACVCVCFYVFICVDLCLCLPLPCHIWHEPASSRSSLSSSLSLVTTVLCVTKDFEWGWNLTIVFVAFELHFPQVSWQSVSAHSAAALFLVSSLNVVWMLLFFPVSHSLAPYAFVFYSDRWQDVLLLLILKIAWGPWHHLSLMKGKCIWSQSVLSSLYSAVSTSKQHLCCVTIPFLSCPSVYQHFCLLLNYAHIHYAMLLLQQHFWHNYKVWKC